MKVSFEVRNIGNRAGGEVAQLYVKATQPTVERPVRELKGFEKVFLSPGESKEITLRLNRLSFAYFDSAAGRWRTDPGEYEIAVGASSRDLRIKQTLTVTP